MRVTIPFLAGAAVLTALAPVAAAPDSGGAATPSPAPTIQPERPGFTNSAEIVPPGLTQIEAGLAYTRAPADSGGGWTTDAPQMLVRQGLTPTLEVRAVLPDYYSNANPQSNFSSSSSSNQTSGSGFGDMQAGVKYKFYQSKDGNTKAALTPLVSLPVGARQFTTGHVDPSLLLAGQTQSGSRWQVQANLFASYPWQGTGRVLNVSASTSTSYQLTSALSAYGDVYDSGAKGSSPTPIADGGFTYLVRSNLQLDLETGVGLGGAAPVRFYSGGVAYRF